MWLGEIVWHGEVGLKSRKKERREGEDCKIVLAELCRLTLNIRPGSQSVQIQSLAGSQPFT